MQALKDMVKKMDAEQERNESEYAIDGICLSWSHLHYVHVVQSITHKHILPKHPPSPCPHQQLYIKHHTYFMQCI